MLHVLGTAHHLGASLLIPALWCVLQRSLHTGTLGVSSALQSCVGFKMKACDSTEDSVSPWVRTVNVSPTMQTMTPENDEHSKDTFCTRHR